MDIASVEAYTHSYILSFAIDEVRNFQPIRFFERTNLLEHYQFALISYTVLETKFNTNQLPLNYPDLIRKTCCAAMANNKSRKTS